MNNNDKYLIVRHLLKKNKMQTVIQAKRKRDPCCKDRLK